MAKLKLKLASIILATISLLACGSQSQLGPAKSSLSQVSERYYECVNQDESTAKYIFKDAPANFFSGWSQSEQMNVMRLMGNLPDEYIKHLFESNRVEGFQVIQQYLGSGIEGVTELGYHPSWVKVSPGDVDTALNHELGHALDFYLENETGGIQNKIYNAYYREKDHAGIGWYAKTDGPEWFAEAFQSFYCSPEAQDFMKQNTPDTYSILNQSLLPARWDSNSKPSDTFKILAYEDTADSGTYSNLSNGYKFMVSAPEGIEEVAVCWSGVVECRDDVSKQNIYRLKETLPNGMKVYYSETAEFSLSGKNTISVIGVDTREDKNVSSQFEITAVGAK